MEQIVESLVRILEACAPVLIALVGIIPTGLSSSKKTQESVNESNAAMEQRIDKVQTTLNDHINEDEDEKARRQRYRILQFYDEICEKRKHSESRFEDILDDIDHYEQYCQQHPDFKNSRGKVAMEHIKTTYAKVKAAGGFLTHSEKGE